jgi:hypothetical protein
VERRPPQSTMAASALSSELPYEVLERVFAFLPVHERAAPLVCTWWNHAMLSHSPWRLRCSLGLCDLAEAVAIKRCLSRDELQDMWLRAAPVLRLDHAHGAHGAWPPPPAAAAELPRHISRAAAEQLRATMWEQQADDPSWETRPEDQAAAELLRVIPPCAAMAFRIACEYAICW